MMNFVYYGSDYFISSINGLFYKYDLDKYEICINEFCLNSFKEFYDTNKHLINEFIYDNYIHDEFISTELKRDFTGKIIHWMVLLNVKEAVNHLLSIGVDINSKDIYGRNCLFWVKDKEMVDFLLENGAEFIEDENGLQCFGHGFLSEMQEYLKSRYEKKLIQDSLNKTLDKPKKRRKM